MAAYYEKQQPPPPPQPQPHLNAAYYGPPIPPPQPAYYPPPPRHGGGPRCLCSLFKVAALAIIALGAATMVLWLIFRPYSLKAYADSATLSRFDLGSGNGNGGGDLLQYNLTVSIRLRNPNRFGIRYDYAQAQAFYDGDRFGFAPLQPFYLDRKSDARITAAFASSAVMDDDDVARTYKRENGEGFYYIKVRVYSDLSFKVRLFRRHGYKSRISCVLRLPVPAAGANANATPVTTTLGTRCDVDF
ncbi:unnamed protein product [Urochloa decumbens]|uniref:Late embryogenesis abundant protein LEA-2 subgroup domain-containing protein n=1 Tax=Urochloa decumbens TaxID=240449 RepID=A0ABC8ZHN1_9POAL